MDRTEVLDEIVKSNTLQYGYSKFDEPVDWNSNAVNIIENVVYPDDPGATFKYQFYIDLYNDDFKNFLQPKISTAKINTPSSFKTNVPDKLIYNSYNLPYFYFHENSDRTEFKIDYVLNFSTEVYQSYTCQSDPSNCDEIFSCRAMKPDGSMNDNHVTHHDIYHLLQFVSKYPQSDKVINDYHNLTVKSSNQNNAVRMFNDFCYFMKKKLGLQQSHENDLTVLKENNFCSFYFNEANPDILKNANNYDGEEITVSGITKTIDPSEAWRNTENYQNYKNVSQFPEKPLQSYPEAKFHFLNYCRGSHFNDPECKEFYYSMFKKDAYDGGVLDQDVQNLLLQVCKTKDTYVPDDVNYYKSIKGDFHGNDIEKKENLTKEECQIACDQSNDCVGFVMNLDVVEFYSDNFTTKIGELGEGKYDVFQLGENGISNDTIVSIKIPDGYIVICYEDGNFAGNSVVLSGNVLLSNVNFQNRISSLQITQFNCEVYKEKYPELITMYGSSCNVLQNHFKEYGMNEGRDASGFSTGKGCFMKRRMTQHTKDAKKISFMKQDTDDVCSCFYRPEYYNDYIEKNNLPETIQREPNSCWFPKCFLGTNSIKADPNRQCSDVVICSTEVYTFLNAQEVKNVDVNILQTNECGKVDTDDDEKEQTPEDDEEAQLATKTQEEKPVVENSSNSFARWAIIGLVVSLLFVIIIVIVVVVVKGKKKRSRQQHQNRQRLLPQRPRQQQNRQTLSSQSNSFI